MNDFRDFKPPPQSYDPEKPSQEYLERYEANSAVGPAAWIAGGMLAALAIFGLFSFGGDSTAPPATQTTENAPAQPAPTPPEPN
jgi:hypothetical protein